MKLVHSQEVLNLDGTPMQQGDKTMTMKDLVVHTLGMEIPDEKLGAEKKARCWALMNKFMKGRKADLTSEDRALIKERAAVTLVVFSGSNILYGRLCDWVEGKDPIVMSDEDDAEEDSTDGEDSPLKVVGE